MTRSFVAQASNLHGISKQTGSLRYAVGAFLFLFLLFFHATTARAETWQSAACENALAFTLPEKPATTTAPLIIYLKNLSAPRAGTESDDAILAGFRRDGFLVAVLDYAKHPRARVPWLNRDIAKLRDELHKKKILADLKIDTAHIFIVPEGCRLARDIVFYDDASAGIPKRTLAMDIIYPSNPRRAVGALMEFSCDNKDRMGNFSMSFCSDSIEAFVSEGFAVVMADHPVAAPYKGLDAMPDCAWKTKAAVRTLRAEGAKFGLNGNIVSLGFSRGSGMALMLVTTEGRADFEKNGRHPGVSSAVQGAVVMAGRFSYMDLLPGDKMVARYTQAWGSRETPDGLAAWRAHGALDYLEKSAPAVPLFLTINSSEGEEYQHQMRVLRKRLAGLRADEIFMMEHEPRGHKMPLDSTVLHALSDYLHRQLDTL